MYISCLCYAGTYQINNLTLHYSRLNITTLGVWLGFGAGKGQWPRNYCFSIMVTKKQPHKKTQNHKIIIIIIFFVFFAMASHYCDKLKLWITNATKMSGFGHPNGVPKT